MKLYAVKQGGMYVNYISLFSSQPMRLRNTTIKITATGYISRVQEHILYTEKEISIVLNLVEGSRAILIDEDK